MRLDPTKILQDLRATYWFIPSCMAMLSVLLSFLMPWLDERYSIDPTGSFGWIGQTQTDGARAVLMTVAGSIVGVAGTTFSITMVAVSFASANFGPRLIANFMRDRGNQLTLGTFIATFVYCLLVLRRVHNAASGDGSASYDAFVPHLSVIVALIMALASVGVLIFFIHHVPETINIDRLVAQIGRRLKQSITELFPDLEVEVADASSENVPAWSQRIDGRNCVTGQSREAGFLQRLDIERLTALADEHSLLVRVQYRPGDFMVEGDTLFEIWPPSTFSANEGGVEQIDESLLEELYDCVESGFQRTPHQDCLFLADQLVEVIARALSPGINDPFTAINCLSWFKSALIEFVERDRKHPDQPDTASVFVHRIDFEQIMTTVFDRTRQYVCTDRSVALHAMTLLAEISVRTSRAEHRDALRQRMDELCAASGASLAAEAGGADVTRRHAEAIRLLDDPVERGSRLDGSGWFGGGG